MAVAFFVPPIAQLVSKRLLAPQSVLDARLVLNCQHQEPALNAQLDAFLALKVSVYHVLQALTSTLQMELAFSAKKDVFNVLVPRLVPNMRAE
jgi:hypothetical protein